VQTTQLTIERVPPTAAEQVVDVLCESFRAYPVMRYVLGESADYDARLRQMIGLFVTARVLLDDVMLGVRQGSELVAVATTSDPAVPSHPDFAARREAVWTALGPAAAARYQNCVTAWQSMESRVPQLHVNMIGVRDAQRGTGLGKRLLQEVHALAASIPDCEGVSLTTEDPRNVAFYQHLGYRVIGEARIGEQIAAWSFLRERDRG
jgi:GNAT superfamily N-acetyltransferase